MLHNEIARLEHDDKHEDLRAALHALLRDANTASQEPVGVRKWWWGTEVERAWAALREVEERTVDLLPNDELLAKAADASAHASCYLKGDDKRLLDLEALRLAALEKKPPEPPAGIRPAIVEVLRASHAQADRVNQEARYLRNRLLLASCLSFLFAAMLVLIQWWFDDVRFLDPPDGWGGRNWAFLLIVMLFGATGALFTAIPAMSKVPSDFGPFNLPLQQAVLKIAFGPLLAVAGFAIVSTEAVQAGAPTKWPGVLLLALAFGAGQQAVTSSVDKRARKILTAAAPSAGDTES